MRLLLDTHIWLWSLLDPDRLGPRTRAALLDPANEKWISPITVWETLLLAERRRVLLEPDPHAWIRAQLVSAPLREAPLTVEVALASRRLTIKSDDPADRFLVGTAAVYELSLVTADSRLRRVRGVTILPNA